MANRGRSAAKSEVPSEKVSNDGPTIKTEQASEAIAAITANIASTTISIPDIDNEPIINHESDEDRTPEESSALVRHMQGNSDYNNSS